METNTPPSAVCSWQNVCPAAVFFGRLGTRHSRESKSAKLLWLYIFKGINQFQQASTIDMVVFD